MSAAFTPTLTSSPATRPLLSPFAFKVPLHRNFRRRYSLAGNPTGLLSSNWSRPSSISDNSTATTSDLEILYTYCKTWQWRSYSINYLVKGVGPSLLLVHGFGASIGHWRRNIAILAESYTVHAIDLLGFGASDKPAAFSYTMEAWAQLILDFVNEIVRKPTVLIGNSVGSLACLIAASESSGGLVRGLVLLNCAGGMNNKAIVDDWRIKLLLPLLWVFDVILKQRRIASSLFNNVKQRDNLKNILLSVYGNKESVDEDLVEIIKRPADDEGALDVFVSVVTGPPGPNPVSLMPRISLPVLVLWGDEDPFTPLDGPVGRYFSSLPSQLPNVSLSILKGVGHCPHDDRPETAALEHRVGISDNCNAWDDKPSVIAMYANIDEVMDQIDLKLRTHRRFQPTVCAGLYELCEL